MGESGEIQTQPRDESKASYYFERPGKGRREGGIRMRGGRKEGGRREEEEGEIQTQQRKESKASYYVEAQV
jgi:hypothetical protein